MTTRNSRAIDAGSLNAMAPPGYGEHQLDQLYNDVDPSGFQTPAGLVSGSATPLAALSRNASTDNLAPMDGVASSILIANTLRNRLDNLNTTADSRAIRDRTQATSSSEESPGIGLQQQGRPPASTSRRTSGQSLSRRTSEEEDPLPSGAQTPMQPSMSHIEYSADDLARVPSYSTALQTRPNIPIDSALPNYHTAIGTPNSSPPVPQPLSQAHVLPRRRGFENLD